MNFCYIINNIKLYCDLINEEYLHANKNHKVYNDETLISNNNTFVIYIKHLFISGKTVEDYYLDNVLHETMHFCGASGASALEEGFTELKTRELASKKFLRTSACGYPKEVKIALKLQELFGKEVCDTLTFINSKRQKELFLTESLGEEMACVYQNVSINMEKEFQEKYYQKQYGGITGPIKKAMKYSSIDYSLVEKYIDQYSENKNTNRERKIV